MPRLLTHLMPLSLLACFVVAGEAHLNATLPSQFKDLKKDWTGKQSSERTVTGNVVAYDLGVELASGTCRQTLIVETGGHRKHGKKYVIIRHDYSCLNRIPEKVLIERQQRSLSVVRDPTCDQLFDDLLYIRGINETGESYQIPRLKRVPGKEREAVSSGRKLPCYILKSGLT